MNNEVYLSTQFKQNLAALPSTQQQWVARALDLLENDPIANSHPIKTDTSANASVRELRADKVRIRFRYVPEESAVILTNLTVGSSLSDDQIQRIAQAFHDLAFEIAQVRLDAVAKGARLTDPRIVQLQGSVYSLLNTAASFVLQSHEVTFDDPARAITAIFSATSKADKALDRLHNLDKAINIGSAVIVLAMAISTKDVAQVEAASSAVEQAAQT